MHPTMPDEDIPILAEHVVVVPLGDQVRHKPFFDVDDAFIFVIVD